MRQYVLKPLILLGILIVAYSTLLVMVFIPTPKILINHIDTAVKSIEAEGLYRNPVLAYAGRIPLDTITDETMLNKARGNSDISPLRNAFSGYARYWHGYLVFLRPMLMFFNYGTIRYLSLFAFTLLMFSIAALLIKKLGMLYTILFGFVLCMSNYNIIPYSLQYSSVFYVMLCAMLVIMLINQDLLQKKPWLACVFLAIGSITNFVDFLTAPLLTLGIPLTLCYILRKDKGDFSFKNNLHYIFIGSIYWMAGYGFTWISKWFLSYFIDSGDITESVFTAVRFRILGNEQYPPDRIQMLKSNISSMYPIVLIVIGFVIILVLLLLIRKHHKPINKILANSPILCLCLFPYLWYIVLANHSEIHYWFTYRIQIITIFALGAFLISCLPEKINIKSIFSGCFSRDPLP